MAVAVASFPHRLHDTLQQRRNICTCDSYDLVEVFSSAQMIGDVHTSGGLIIYGSKDRAVLLMTEELLSLRITEKRAHVGSGTTLDLSDGKCEAGELLGP